MQKEREFNEFWRDVFQKMRENPTPITDELRLRVEEKTEAVSQAVLLDGTTVKLRWNQTMGAAVITVRGEMLEVQDAGLFGEVVNQALNFDVCRMADGSIEMAIVFDMKGEA